MPTGAAAAIGGAILGTGAKIAGSVIEGNAKADIAKAKQAQAQHAQELAAPTAAELGQIDKTIATSDKAIARQEQLISALDPTIVAASKNALDLLNGKEAPTLNPLRQERERQRSLLESNLREQLGSGYATSSSGSEALNRFDMQTGQLTSQAQQSYLGSVSNTLGTVSGARSSAEGALAQQESFGLRAGEDLGRISERQAGAAMGGIPTAGSQYYGALATGQTIGEIGSGITQLAGAAASFGGGGAGGLSKLVGGGGGSGVPAGYGGKGG